MVLFVDRTTGAAHFMELCLTYLVTHSNNVATSLCISVVLASHLTRLELKFSFMCAYAMTVQILSMMACGLQALIVHAHRRGENASSDTQ